MSGHLGREHFIIHALVHCVKHLSGSGFIEMKWFIDLLYAINTGRVDRSKIMDISRTWGVEKDILPVMATLNKHWHTEILLPREAVPLDLQAAIWGINDPEKRSYAELPMRYVDPLLKFRYLPSTYSQARYLFRLFFPTEQNLRWRYHLSSKWSIIPYYLVHFLNTCKKFFTGLWYQISYRPSPTK